MLFFFFFSSAYSFYICSFTVITEAPWDASESSHICILRYPRCVAETPVPFDDKGWISLILQWLTYLPLNLKQRVSSFIETLLYLLVEVVSLWELIILPWHSLRLWRQEVQILQEDHWKYWKEGPILLLSLDSQSYELQTCTVSCICHWFNIYLVLEKRLPPSQTPWNFPWANK